METCHAVKQVVTQGVLGNTNHRGHHQPALLPLGVSEKRPGALFIHQLTVSFGLHQPQLVFPISHLSYHIG